MNDLSLLLRKSSTLPTQVPEFYYLRRKSWGKPGNEAKAGQSKITADKYYCPSQNQLANSFLFGDIQRS
jgi:hypothetical protein